MRSTSIQSPESSRNTFPSAVLCAAMSISIAFACLVPQAFAGADKKDSTPRLPARAEGVHGKAVSLAIPANGALVVVFYSTECPISNAYTPTLNAISSDYAGKPVRLVAVCADPDLTDGEILKHERDYAIRYEVAVDRRGVLAARLGAKLTPEAFVVDSSGVIRYRGRIDDQFASRGKRRVVPQTHELRDAIEAVLAAKLVPQAEVEAVGCPLPDSDPGRKTAQTPTFAREIAPILQKHCQECHRPGQVGPFSLITYTQAKKRADDIARVVDSRTMPPWKPTPDFGVELVHPRTLSAAEIDRVVAWAEGGAPEGDPADLPPPVSFPEGWALGTPDLIVQPSDDFSIPASGGDIYRCFVVPTDLPADVAIEAVEYRPGNRRVVHHILAYVDATGKGRERDKADPGLGYSCFGGPGIEIHGDLGGWAPGNEPARLPEGVGRALPKKADVIIQVHYHPTGKDETDRSALGLYFSKKPVKKNLHWNAALNPEIVIKPGDRNYEATAWWRAPVDLEAYAVTPHMHLLGIDMTMSLVFADGREQDLVQVLDWDFNWQNTYNFAKPVPIPAGTYLKVVAHYDNSESNPRNPNHPPKEVRWGEATTDEMCIGFIAVTQKDQDLTRPGAKDQLLEIFEKSESKDHSNRLPPGAKPREKTAASAKPAFKAAD
jgi:thiol-disulfide isomerase/thioredoxin